MQGVEAIESVVNVHKLTHDIPMLGTRDGRWSMRGHNDPNIGHSLSFWAYLNSLEFPFGQPSLTRHGFSRTRVVPG